jgi:hypothetical protein
MPVGTTNPRVTAADPGAWLDGEPWTATLTFVNPGSVTPENPDGDPTDLTGSRLYIKFCAQGPAGLVDIQICDSAAGDGSLVMPTATDGRATFNAVPEARTWTAPRYGPGLLLLPALVFGDVYRQVDGGEPICLTRLTLRVLPTTGAPVGSVGPAPKLLTGQITALSRLAGALVVTPPVQVSGVIAANANLQGAVTITPVVALSGGVAGAATLAGAITVSTVAPTALAGAIQGTPSLTGAASVIPSVALTGGIVAAATLRGNLLVSVALVGTIPGGGSLTGSVGSVAAQPLVGTIPAPTGPAGTLSVAGTYAGSIAGSGALTGALSTAVALSGAVTGAPALTGALTAIAPANLNGAIPAPVGPQGSATTAPGLVNARKGRLMAAAAA